MKILILAGGSGTRLWPLSRQRYPKQFIKLIDNKKSLFQETFERGLKLADIDDIYVITNKDYKFLVMGEVDELGYEYNKENILLEPLARNTLPAIYYGVDEVIRESDDSIVVFPSDHSIKNDDKFVEIIKESEKLSEESIITFGIRPDNPNTGYGYISFGDKRLNGYVVNEFKEKPNKEVAQKYLEEGYLWNSGIFMFNPHLFVDEVKKHSKSVYNAFKNNSEINKIFDQIESVSIDYGLMEKTDNVSVVPIDIGWNDLGSFDSFYEVFDKDKNDNIVNNENILIDSSKNLIHSEKGKIIVGLGIEDLIIIDKKDALLVCKKNHSQKVKDIVDILKKKNDKRTEFHIEDYRPWGRYKVLEEEKNSFKIKRITVLQGKKLSYQLHHHRSEHWVVVKGMAKVTIDDKISFVRPGESIFMKEGQRHRLENPGKVPLEIIEVQMGSYLEEDDIIRIDDEYDRK